MVLNTIEGAHALAVGHEIRAVALNNNISFHTTAAPGIAAVAEIKCRGVGKLG